MSKPRRMIRHATPSPTPTTATLVAAPAAPPAVDWLTDRQITAILAAINANRVNYNDRGEPYLTGYDVKRHLTRIFGVCRWSKHVVSLTCAREIFHPAEGDDEQDRTTLAYTAVVRLTARTAKGAIVGEWEDVGGADTGPTSNAALAAAIVNAQKAAVTDALKRCAVDALGDQGGLSLRNDRDPLGPVVIGTWVDGRAAPQLPDPDAESELVEPERPGRHRVVDPAVADLLTGLDLDTDPEQVKARMATAKKKKLLGEHAGQLARPDGRHVPATVEEVLHRRLAVLHAQPLGERLELRPTSLALAAGAGQLDCGCDADTVLRTGQHGVTCTLVPVVPASNGSHR